MQHRKFEADQVISQLQNETMSLSEELKQLSFGNSNGDYRASATAADNTNDNETYGADLVQSGELVYTLEKNLKAAMEREITILTDLVDTNEEQLGKMKTDVEKEMSGISQKLKFVNTSIASAADSNNTGSPSPNNSNLGSSTNSTAHSPDHEDCSVSELITHNKNLHVEYIEEQVRGYDVTINTLSNSIQQKKMELLELKQAETRQREER